MRLCIQNKNLFRVKLSNSELFKNKYMNIMFNVKNSAFSY